MSVPSKFVPKAKSVAKTASTRVPKTERWAAARGRNSNVSKILPLTTLRTIDLGGRKLAGPLFSIFCAKTACFFEGNSAPEYVQSRLDIEEADRRQNSQRGNGS